MKVRQEIKKRASIKITLNSEEATMLLELVEESVVLPGYSDKLQRFKNTFLKKLGIIVESNDVR